MRALTDEQALELLAAFRDDVEYLLERYLNEDLDATELAEKLLIVVEALDDEETYN